MQNVFTNQLKKIVGVLAAEAQSLSQPKDLAKFSFDKANEFGMGDEISQYKNLIESPVAMENPDQNSKENILKQMEIWEGEMV